MQSYRFLLSFGFIFIGLTLSGQLYYTTDDGIYSYSEDLDIDEIILSRNDLSFDQFGINESTNQIHLLGGAFSGFSRVYGFDGKPCFDCEGFIEADDFSSFSMVIDGNDGLLFYAVGDGIESYGLGSSPIVQGEIIEGEQIFGLALDETDKKLYYSDRQDNRIYSINYDGSDKLELIHLPSGLADPRGLTIDKGRGKIYWANTGQKKIQRANLDGTEIEDVLVDLETPENLSINLEENILYITDIGQHSILSYDIDLEKLDVLIEDDEIFPSKIEFNTDTGFLFWSDRSSSINRIDVTTKENQSVLIGVYSTFGFSVDELQNYIFAGGGDGGIARFNIDGSFGKRLLEDRFIYSFDVDVLNDDLYYSSSFGEIFKTNYEGDIDSLLYSTEDDDFLDNIHVDGLNEKIYWLENGKIYESKLNDFNKVLFFEHEDGIKLFTFDYLNQKIYFANNSLVYIADFDGSNVEPLIGSTIDFMVVDPSNERLLYSNNGNVFSSKLDGYYEELYLDVNTVNFTFGSTDSYLLLPTLDSDAIPNQGSIDLSWTIAPDFNGFNSSGLLLGDFEIEKRNSFGDFVNIGAVPYNSNITTYSFEDSNPEIGVNEYRLKYTSDTNGLTSYSKYFSTDYITTSVLEADEKEDFYFSLFNQKLYNEGNSGILTIYTAEGTIVFQDNIDRSDSEIDLAFLSQGSYFFSLSHNKKVLKSGTVLKI